MDDQKVTLRFGENGEIVDAETGEVIGYAPGHDPGGAIDHAALEAPFTGKAVKQRKGPEGMIFDYVSTDTVIRRLNRATHNQWDFAIVGYQFLPGGKNKNGNAEQVMVVHGRLTIPGLGSRDGFGIQRLPDPVVNADDLIKAAAGDALKRAAVSFGVAIALYGPDIEAGEAPKNAPAPARAPQKARQDESHQPAPKTPEKGRGAPPLRVVGEVPDSYPEVPGIRNTQDLVDFMNENGFEVTDYTSAIREARRYGKETHGVDNIIVGTGDPDEKRGGRRVWPSDIANALGYWFGVEAERQSETPDGARAAAEARQAAARDTKGETDDFDDVPF